MDIILDTSTIQHEMSGTGYYTKGMLRELLKLNSTNVVHTLGGNKELLQELDNGKVVYHYPNVTDWHALINFKLAANRPNIKGNVALFPNYFIPFGFSTPSIVTIHDLSFLSHPHFYSWKMRLFYRRRIQHSFKNANRILTVSLESKKQILKHSGRSPEDVALTVPGPSLPLDRLKISSPSPSKYFLWNGNIELRKNVIPTVKAFLEARLDEHHLVIAGKRFCGNCYWNEFTRRIDQSNNIHYLGYIDNNELKKWYSGADGVICCSFIEGLGIPIVNARSLQKLCLISDYPALKEAAGRNAVIVNPNNQHDISRGFQEMAQLQPLKCQNTNDFYAAEHESQWNDFSANLEEIIHKTAFEIKGSAVVSFAQPGLSELEKSIIKTLAYSAVFSAPIKLRECYRELHYAYSSYSNFKQTLQELSIKYPDMIALEGNYTGLKPYIKSIEDQKRALEVNNRLIETHIRLIDIISKLPWISGVYFSGGTVHASHLDKPDIDLFIITKSNRIWPVYTLLKFVAFVTRKKELLCFNYLIDQNNLQVQTQQDLYTAHQILHLKPAMEHFSQPDLKTSNAWIYNFFPNSEPNETKEAMAQKIISRKEKSRNWFMETVNLLLMALWSWRWSCKGIKNRTGGTRWDAHQVKLHTHDHRPWVYKRFTAIQTDVQQQLNDPIWKEINNYSSTQNKGCA